MNQLDIHKKIDKFLSQNPQEMNPNKEELKNLLVDNYDARNYCFSTAGSEWIEWFDNNNFFAEFHKKNTDFATYRLSELDYLVRIADDVSEIVVDIMEKVELGKKPNVEVIDRFFWILGQENFPVEQITRIIQNIYKQEWIRHAGNKQSGYSYERIIKKLSSEDYNETLLLFTKSLLLICTQKEISKSNSGYGSENPFYIENMTQSGIFDALVNISDDSQEKALEIVINTLKEVIGNEKAENGVFEIQESFYLLDEDFFGDFNVDDSCGLSYRGDIKNLVATVKILSEKAMKNACGKSEEEARRIFDILFAKGKLPDTKTVWKLKLFVLSQCPKIFKEELHKMMWQIFKGEKYGEYISGTEYEKALRAVFPYFDEKTERREYIQEVFSYFTEQEKKSPDQNWHLRYGGDILLSIKDYLTDDEKKKLKTVFKRDFDEPYEPEPSVGKIQSGFVQDVSLVDFSQFEVKDIPEILKTELIPEKIEEEGKGDSFLSPRNIEGTGNALREDLKKRVGEYLEFAKDFFMEGIDIQYKYSFLRGVEELLRDKKDFSNTEWGQLFELFKKIKGDNKQDIDDDKSHRARWSWVYSNMAEILLFVNQKDFFRDELFAKYRKDIIEILEFLFKEAKDPGKEDEDPKYGDLFHIAINSTRGRAFQAFVNFIHRDGEGLSDESKKLYAYLLDNEKSSSIRFVMGYYLAGFYFRSKEWTEEKFEDLFYNHQGTDPYTPAWQGYINGTLYIGLFKKLEEYYKKAILIEKYPDRKYEKKPDETLGTHLALAFAHFDDVDWNHSLIKELFTNGNKEKQHEFISFIGRGVLSRSQAGEEWFKEKNVKLNKLKDLWEKLLDEDLEPHVYAGFGFWLNHKKDIFKDDKWLVKIFSETLAKSKGEINWDYGFKNNLKKFAGVDPERTLKMIRDFLLLNGGLNPHRQGPLFIVDNEIKEALEIIYKKVELRKGVDKLVNDLIEKGGSMFWGLKDILEK